MAKRSSSKNPQNTPAEDNSKTADLLKDTDDSSDAVLTSNQGVPVNDDQQSLKAGERGPTLLEDFLASREDHTLRSRAHS